MLRLVAGQLLRRRGRTLAVVAAIVAAAVSFSLLTSAVATSRLEVQGTVKANYRSAYDILVRPANSTTPLERSRRLVQENYLSGIYGGITMKQYHTIQHIPGVQVAAPVAMIGYMLPYLYPDENLTGLVTKAREQVFRIKQTWITDRGLSHIPAANEYVYVTGDKVTYRGKSKLPLQTDPITGKQVSTCSVYAEFAGGGVLPNSAFDYRLPQQLGCFSTNPPTPQFWANGPRGHVGIGVTYQYPILLAAIDPVAEAKLVGLNRAMVSGRYLTSSDHTRSDKRNGGAKHVVPVLMADHPLSDDTWRVQVQRMVLPHPDRVPGIIASRKGAAWLQHLHGPTARTTNYSNQRMYPKLVARYSDPRYFPQTQYWSAGPVGYSTTPQGHLVPQPQHSPAVTWVSPLEGRYIAPPGAADTNYRRLNAHLGSSQIIQGFNAAPLVRPVGTFDPSRITGFSKLSAVPLTTYYPPDAAPGNARSSRLLGGRSLLPNSNLAGYLQQPPMMLTTIRSLSSFTDPQAFLSNTATSATTSPAKAPISVIRVRVAGVTGVDKLSQERVRLAAESIVRKTGLDVDVTIGSSPTPQLIGLPAGRFGRPALTLSEGWVQKGAAVRLLNAVDAKSLALFALVLLVCLLFMLNATVAAVRTRRAELGVLACLGWPAKRIFGLLELELVTTGLVAGLVGTGIAAGLTAGFHLHTTWWQLLLITPVATVLAGAAGIGPVWRACRASPVEAITPAVRAPRRAGRVRSITRLAVVGVARWPGRTLLGAASLFIGVAALAILIAIQTAFQGGVAGTLLGNVIAVQVRAVDYLAAGLTVGLGAFAVADIAYLNIAERTAEIGTFRASGWTENHLRRLFGTEAVITACVGAIAGAVVGVTTVAVLFSVAWTTVLIAAAASAAIGILAAVLALTLPLIRLTRLAPATAITTE